MSVLFIPIRVDLIYRIFMSFQVVLILGAVITNWAFDWFFVFIRFCVSFEITSIWDIVHSIGNFSINQFWKHYAYLDAFFQINSEFALKSNKHLLLNYISKYPCICKSKIDPRTNFTRNAVRPSPIHCVPVSREHTLQETVPWQCWKQRCS